MRVFVRVEFVLLLVDGFFEMFHKNTKYKLKVKIQKTTGIRNQKGQHNQAVRIHYIYKDKRVWVEQKAYFYVQC